MSSASNAGKRRVKVRGAAFIWRAFVATALVVTGCSGDEPSQSQRDAGKRDASIDVSFDGDASAPEPCGEEGQTCCAARSCNQGLTCARNFLGPEVFCVRCGDKNQPCCGAELCNPGLVCQPGITSTSICREPLEAGPDACRVECSPPGGNYCGRINNRCGRPFDCGMCTGGFECGGGGVPNLCGAARDSGICDATVCETPAGKYCGVVGDGCGGSISCGDCPPYMTCGGGGVPNLCGAADGGCTPSTCEKEGTRFCGTIHDGCGQMLDCGACPGAQRCGEVARSVCGFLCPECPRCDGEVTSVRGVAVTGAATSPDPIPGALVYVPRLAPGAQLPPLPAGASCRQCTPVPTEDMIAWTVTGLDGRFALGNVPAGPAVPIVVQLGGWRRVTTMSVTACSNNELPAGTVRLPRNRNEGDIPLTALVTGSHDPIECVLRKMGIEDGEFTNPTGKGRIHVYRGTGATLDGNTPDGSSFTNADAGNVAWMPYTQVLLPCRGAELRPDPSALGNFNAYLDRGGRVLATHFSYSWLDGNGSWTKFGTWTRDAGAPPDPLLTDVVNTPKANDFAATLAAANALVRTSPPQISIGGAHASLGAIGAGAELWMSSFSPPTTQLAFADPPRDATSGQGCGRFAFADFHATSAASPGATFPSECAADLALSPAEKALEYVLFELASCIGPKATPTKLPPLPPRPLPPPVIPPPPPPGPVDPAGPASENAR